MYGKNSLIEIVKVKSSIDNSIEEVFFIPAKRKNAPLLVKLHTWSFSKEAEKKEIKNIFKSTGWNILAPEFRGPNLANNPRAKEACGSKLAKQDIADAVYFIQKKYHLTSKQVFLLGGSGGGHMALLMAASYPSLWSVVCAWCPITDLNKWRFENLHYKTHIEACCDSKYQYAARSPINYIDEISKARVYISHGKCDNSVPFTHSLELYNKIIKKHPKADIFLNIFRGGHEIKVKEALIVFKSFLTANSKKLHSILSK
ncbi:MAG: prolyl oligopeptidase family serine peptidase [Elusimicrobia bacterium]|nr:prolyl oligopeptidase family serine peptidase [Elusimicrobiota bacterium]